MHLHVYGCGHVCAKVPVWGSVLPFHLVWGKASALLHKPDQLAGLQLLGIVLSLPPVSPQGELGLQMHVLLLLLGSQGSELCSSKRFSKLNRLPSPKL